MVHGAAYNGDVTRNPFHFKKFGLQTPKILVNAEEYPSEPIVRTHDDESRDILGYDQLIRQSGALLGGREMLISPEDWSEFLCGLIFLILCQRMLPISTAECLEI